MESTLSELGLTLFMAIARNPETAAAKALALWKTAILNARSDGLYQNEKYIMQHGTAAVLRT